MLVQLPVGQVRVTPTMHHSERRRSTTPGAKPSTPGATKPPTPGAKPPRVPGLVSQPGLPDATGAGGGGATLFINLSPHSRAGDSPRVQATAAAADWGNNGNDHDNGNNNRNGSNTSDRTSDAASVWSDASGTTRGSWMSQDLTSGGGNSLGGGGQHSVSRRRFDDSDDEEEEKKAGGSSSAKAGGRGRSRSATSPLQSPMRSRPNSRGPPTRIATELGAYMPDDDDSDRDDDDAEYGDYGGGGGRLQRRNEKERAEQEEEEPEPSDKDGEWVPLREAVDYNEQLRNCYDGLRALRTRCGYINKKLGLKGRQVVLVLKTRLEALAKDRTAGEARRREIADEVGLSSGRRTSAAACIRW